MCMNNINNISVSHRDKLHFTLRGQLTSCDSLTESFEKWSVWSRVRTDLGNKRIMKSCFFLLLIQVVSTVMLQLKIPFDRLSALPSPELTVRSISRLDEFARANKFCAVTPNIFNTITEVFAPLYTKIFIRAHAPRNGLTHHSRLWFLNIGNGFT